MKQDGTKCKVLALNDGDDLMVYEAAAIKGLFDNLPTEEADYDVITGQSFSAISAVFLATYPKGQEKQAAADLLSIWK